MRKLLLSVVLAGLASVANAATYTVDFDSYALNKNIKGRDLGGVVLESKGFIQMTPTGTYGLLVDNKGNYAKPFVARFTTPEVTSVSVDLGDWGYDADRLFLEAYDASNTLLGKVTSFLPAFTAGMRTLSLNSLVDIAYVKFYGIGLDGQNNVYADNLSFSTREEPNVVPLPAAGVLLASGFGLVALLRRRRT